MIAGVRLVIDAGLSQKINKKAKVSSATIKVRRMSIIFPPMVIRKPDGYRVGTLERPASITNLTPAIIRSMNPSYPR